jgi:hypothetical protein
MIEITVMTVALYAAIAFLLLKIMNRFFGWKAAIAAGICVVTLLIWGSYTIHATCGVPPVFVAPKCNNPNICGDGQMRFACDSAGGAMAYATANIAHPISAILTAIFTYFVARKSWRSRPES